ncbi:MAG: acyltransferase [Planctomycetota bacterium]|jgi:peptidoglycan/LPS O-acetylase OafA/YrhL|nr:acyltransferase [Planctomycetota bacterium]
MANERQNCQYITIARGLLILVIAVAHGAIPQIRRSSGSAGIFWYLAYSVGLPVFIAFSGFLFEQGLESYRRQGYARFLWRKFTSLMLPYFSISFLTYFAIALLYRLSPFDELMTRYGFVPQSPATVIHAILTLEDTLTRHLWFCYTLFLIFTVSYPLASFFRTLAGLLPAFLLFLVAIAYPESLPKLAERVCHYLVFFHLGRRLRDADALFAPRLIPIHAAATAAIFTAMELLGTQRFGIFAGLFNFGLSFFGTVCFIGISRLLIGRPPERHLAFLGEYSYDIYLIHQPFLTAGAAGALFALAPCAPAWPIMLAAAGVGVIVSLLIGRFVLRPVPVLRTVFLGMGGAWRYKKRDSAKP